MEREVRTRKLLKIKYRLTQLIYSGRGQTRGDVGVPWKGSLRKLSRDGCVHCLNRGW